MSEVARPGRGGQDFNPLVEELTVGRVVGRGQLATARTHMAQDKVVQCLPPFRLCVRPGRHSVKGCYECGRGAKRAR